MKLIFTALIALLATLGLAFATTDNATALHAEHLTLQINKAIAVGEQVIVKAQELNASTTELQAILNQLKALPGSFDAQNLTAIQDTRNTSKRLVTEFRALAQQIIPPAQRDGLHRQGKYAFERNYGKSQQLLEEKVLKHNQQVLDQFAKREQKRAIGEDEELSPRMRDHMNNFMPQLNASKAQIDAYRTQIRANAQAMRLNQTQSVQELHTIILKKDVTRVEFLIEKKQADNQSTTQLEALKAKLASVEQVTPEQFTQLKQEIHDLLKQDMPPMGGRRNLSENGSRPMQRGMRGEAQ